MCVATCPTNYWAFLTQVAIEEAIDRTGVGSTTRSDVMICKDSINPDTAQKVLDGVDDLLRHSQLATSRHALF